MSYSSVSGKSCYTLKVDHLNRSYMLFNPRMGVKNKNEFIKDFFPFMIKKSMSVYLNGTSVKGLKIPTKVAEKCSEYGRHFSLSKENKKTLCWCSVEKNDNILSFQTDFMEDYYFTIVFPGATLSQVRQICEEYPREMIGLLWFYLCSLEQDDKALLTPCEIGDTVRVTSVYIVGQRRYTTFSVENEKENVSFKLYFQDL